MHILKKIGTFIRNAWLASLGAFRVSTKTTTKSINAIGDKSEHTISELIVEGGSLEIELVEKLKLRDGLNRRISAINNALGRRNVVNEDKLLLMTDKVDQLTIVVNQLIAKKLAEKKQNRKPRKAAIKKVVAA